MEGSSLIRCSDATFGNVITVPLSYTIDRHNGVPRYIGHARRPGSLDYRCDMVGYMGMYLCII